MSRTPEPMTPNLDLGMIVAKADFHFSLANHTFSP